MTTQQKVTLNKLHREIRKARKTDTNKFWELSAKYDQLNAQYQEQEPVRL